MNKGKPQEILNNYHKNLLKETQIQIKKMIQKGNANMSQCLLMKNKYGVVLLSDSAITTIENGQMKVETNHPKVFVGSDCIWTHAGILDYEDDIARELNNTQVHIKTRLNAIIKELEYAIQQPHDFPFRYQLIACQPLTTTIKTYLVSINENEIQCLESTKSSQTTIFQPIGLYSSLIVDEVDETVIEEMDLEELVGFGTEIIKKYIDYDVRNNSGMFVNGDIYAIAMDANGHISRYINNKKTHE